MKTHSLFFLKSYNIVMVLAALAVLLLHGCGAPPDNRRAAFILIDISGDYASELQQARTLSNYLLANLNSGDSLAIAFIDNSSFTERNVIAQATFDHRPSVASQQKRLFQSQVDGFLDKFRVPSHHSDITGGILLASDYLHEMEAGQKHLFILSDLHEDLPPWLDREVKANLDSVHVVAVNVKRQRGDNNNPREYQERLAGWQQRVEEGGGHWMLVNDMARLERAWQ
ncbi:VWA domain-containing protein [Marinimicrobium sp. ABcell2]|uniref:VWA domain-containing protein n=1 Tax=Marinimicrobium sp. ABcell2 TaxID=3069751 RepID=UPI0027B22202|nr:VWA domain-containing protein [Marinimicrobium sp. ABcell2]MDQ2076795.1 VWA domain-containing protein [Marinimicrobium sp. ABcell2]